VNAASILTGQSASATSVETADATPPAALKDRTDSPPAQNNFQSAQSEQEDNTCLDHQQHEQDKHEESVDDQDMLKDQQEGTHEDTQGKLQEETQEEEEEVEQQEEPETVGNSTETEQEKDDDSIITSGSFIDLATPENQTP
jgi:hypothetical protein